MRARALALVAAILIVSVAHIHQGAAAENGPVKVDTGLTASSPIAFNVHTVLHADGVVRGQLVATK